MAFTVLALAVFGPLAHAQRAGEVQLQLGARTVSASGGNATAAFLGGRVGISDDIELYAELPWYDSPGATGGRSIGAPALGASLLTGDPWARGEVELRVGHEDALSLPVFESDVGRWEAFLGDVTSLRGKIVYDRTLPSGFSWRAQGDLAGWFANEGQSQSEVVAGYSGLVGYGTDRFRVLGGLEGRIIASNGNASFSDRSFNQLDFSGSAMLGRFAPTVFLILPLDDNAPDYSLGVSVSVVLTGGRGSESR